LAEVEIGRPLFEGKNELDQIHQIFRCFLDWLIGWLEESFYFG